MFNNVCHFLHDNHSMVFFHRILTQFDWYMPDSIANWIVFAQLCNSLAEVLALLNSCATTSYSAVILTNTYFLYCIHTFLNLPTADFGKRDKKKMDAIPCLYWYHSSIVCFRTQILSKSCGFYCCCWYMYNVFYLCTCNIQSKLWFVYWY